MQIQNAILTGSTTVYGPITFVSGTLAGSASYAATSSYADTFTVAGSLTAQTLVVQTITSSVSFITGSTRFGSLQTNTHTFTGSLQVTGSGPHTVFGNVQVGNTASVGTTTPVILSLGGTFNSATAGSNVKLRVYDDGSSIGGMSVSSGQMEVNTWSSGKIAFYRGTTQTAVIDAGGNLGIGTATPISRLQVETSSISSGNILTLRNSAVWSTPMMTSIAIRDSNNDVGAIGWRYNGSGGTVDMHIHSLYNNAYTNTSNIVMTVRGNGNVGIGTVLPNALLHVSGSGSGSLMQISSHVSSNIFFVSGSGNVGIGTTDIVSTNLTGSLTIRKSYNGDTPNGATTQAYFSNQSALYLFGRNSGLSIISNNNEEGKIAFGNNSTAIYASIATGTGATSVGGDMYFKVGSDTERMRITSGGVVGIGVTNPSVYGSIGLAVSGSATNSIARVAMVVLGPANGLNIGDDLTDVVMGPLNSATKMHLLSRAGGVYTRALTVDSAGLVGIGTTSPSNLLSVVQSNSAASTTLDITNSSNASTTTKTAQLLFRISDTANDLKPAASIIAYPDGVNNISSGIYFSTRASDGGPFERMRITSGGVVLIGKTATAAFGTAGWQFDPAGSGLAAFAINNNEAFIFNNINTGTTYQIDFRTNAVERGAINVTDSGTTYTTTSDYRVKEDFKDFNGLEKLTNIKVYDFKFKHLDERMDGVIAHELQEVIPYAVHGEKDGAKFQSVDYSRIVPVLVKSIQELSTKLEEATTRIKTLESK